MPAPTYQSEVLEELKRIPPEFLPAFLQMVRAFRESVVLPSAQESFDKGWQEAVAGQTWPVADLWEGLDAE